MADLQLPNLGRGAAGIDQAIELLQVVTRSLNRATDKALKEQGETGNGEGGTEGNGAHRA